MKNVYANSAEVSHLWAHQIQYSARCRNVFFNGPRYYSYGSHYCIGVHLKDGYVAVNREKSSVTTSGHVHEALFAVSHLKVLRVYRPGDGPDQGRTHLELDRLLALAAKAVSNGPSYMLEAHRLVEDYNTYCRLDGRDDLVMMLPNADLVLLKKTLRDQARLEKVRAEERAKMVAEDDAEQIVEWRADRSHWVPAHSGTLLRIHLGQVHTSKGAYIPFDAAKALWPVIRRVTRGEKDYEVGTQLGLYRLTKIRKDGSIVVGCHDICYTEIAGIAEQLGLIGKEAVC